MGMSLGTAKHEVAAGFVKSPSLPHQRSSWNVGTLCKCHQSSAELTALRKMWEPPLQEDLSVAAGGGQAQPRVQALSSGPPRTCRRFLHLTRSHFNAVLLDKAGTDRERYISPVSPDELFVFIDTYLLSEREVARRVQSGDPCE